MDDYHEILRGFTRTTPEMVLGYFHERMPNYKQDLSRIVAMWQHGNTIVINEKLAAPLTEGKWPDEPNKETIWYLSEIMPGVSRDDTLGFLGVYLASLLLHYEGLSREAAIPRSPICTAVIAQHVMACKDGKYAAIMCGFLSNTYLDRNPPFDDSVFPCPELAILILMLSTCERLSQIIGRGIDEGLRTWLWNTIDELPEDVSLTLWRNLVREYQDRHPTSDILNGVKSVFL